MSTYKDLRGQVFGRLTVVDLSHRSQTGKHHWTCICECGTSRIVDGAAMLSGNTKSCGCLKREVSAARSLRHGHYNSKTFRSWAEMKTRCQNVNRERFKHHGGRGIKVCERWQKFENFYADMGERPPGKTLDRIDNDGHYEPANCRWATPAEQARNTRRTVKITINGETKCQSDWSREFGISLSTVRTRVKAGWPWELALATPPRSVPKGKESEVDSEILIRICCECGEAVEEKSRGTEGWTICLSCGTVEGYTEEITLEEYEARR